MLDEVSSCKPLFSLCLVVQKVLSLIQQIFKGFFSLIYVLIALSELSCEVFSGTDPQQGFSLDGYFSKGLSQFQISQGSTTPGENYLHL